MNRKYQIAVFLAVLVNTIGQTTFAGQTEAQEAFFQQFASLCGVSFVGQSVFPEDPGDDWRDKQLVAHIETCSADEIRIPFMVGDDHSRTWVLRRVDGGIELKHDHRHADGTPDTVTMYGGTTQSAGSPLSQSFAADAYTAELIPEAATNEWFLTFSEDGTQLTYYLERYGKPRFKAVLQKASPQDERVTAVENGLLPANVFKGDQPWTLQERMQHYGVPGVGIAVIHDSKVAWFKTYGLADRETGELAKNSTLFQAGSVSKPVAAFGALQMVEAGELSLDGDINTMLKSWKLPDNEFTADSKVTLKQLLSHTGGLTVHGFGGYAVGDEVPSVIQVLDGSGPANSAPVRVDKAPGEGYRYSGGGYTIAQLMMTDASGKPFEVLMDELLINPINMTQSTYQQPLPPALLKHAAAGILPDGTAVEGKRHTYPEKAAAGLWTTAGDLALFAIEMQSALKGESKLMSKDMAQTMTTPVDSGYGLGWGIRRVGASGYFGHGGWDEGFCTQLTAHLDGGYGVVVMINSNHPDFMQEVVNAVGHTYGWDGYEAHDILPVPEQMLNEYPGRYHYNAAIPVVVTSNQGKLYLNYPGAEAAELIYTGNDLFMRRSRPAPIKFTSDEKTIQFNFVLGDGEYEPHRRLADDEYLPGEILETGTYEDALAVFRTALKNNPDEETLSENYLNGYALNSLAESPAFSTKLLQINTDLYPDSANTWDSLAYAYQQAGDNEKAIEHYRNALKRDPKFASALKVLSELTSAEKE